MSLLLSPQPIQFSNYHANKAEYKIPPWWNDTQQLRSLMIGAWEETAADWLQRVLDGLEKGDSEVINNLLKSIHNLGDDFFTIIGDSAEALLSTTQIKAHAANMRAGQAVLQAPRIADYDRDYQEYIAHVQAEQIRAFAREFPQRILHPEIVRQLEFARASDLTTSVDQARITERLERFSRLPGGYWESTSDVHVARLWHADNVALADANGMAEAQIIGVWDKRTCPVCRRLIGHVVDVRQAMNKIRADLHVKEPDEYVEAWAFPRLSDVDNISATELEAKGYFPPFHGRCRCSLVWLTR